MTDADWFGFLLKCHVGAIGHTGRTLGQHLQGTYALLRQWGCEETACRAGLFHSIYGTNAFGHVTVERNSRDLIRELIGEPAEKLVYVFHSSDRPQAWFEAVFEGGISSRISRQFIPLSEWEVARLVEIECANLVEQRRGKAFLERFSALLEVADVPVIESVRHAISAACT